VKGISTENGQKFQVNVTIASVRLSVINFGKKRFQTSFFFTAIANALGQWCAFATHFS